MPNSREDRKRIYLGCRLLLKTHSAKKQNSAKVRDTILSNHSSLGTLLADIGEAKVVDIATKMTRAKIFKSVKRARVEFPDLFPTRAPPVPAPPVPAPNAEMTVPAEDSTAEAFPEDTLAGETAAEDTLAEITHSDDEEADDLAAKDVTVETSELPPEVESSGKDAPKLSPVPAPKSIDPVSAVAKRCPQLCGVPSLHPSFLPYSAQHRILTTAQTILEECCFDFAVRWLPDVLENNGWKLACAVELTQWETIVHGRCGQLPPEALGVATGAKVRRIFAAVRPLRNTAVHREPTEAHGVSHFLGAAVKLAETLRDTHRASQLIDMKAAVDAKIEAMELMKRAMEERVATQVETIRRQKEELDRQERALIKRMLKDDREHNELAGQLLEISVTDISKRKKQTHPAAGTEGSDDKQWLNLVWFFYVVVTVYWARGKSLVVASKA